MTNPNESKAATAKEAVERAKHWHQTYRVYWQYRPDPKMDEKDTAALATLEALAEENEQQKALIVDLTRDMNEEHDRAEKAEAELTQKTKDYDWMMAQHDAWKACAFKEAGLKDGFKAELDKARPMVEAAVAVVEAAKENPLTSEMQAVVGDLRAALATLEALAEENAALKREVERLNGAYKWLSQTNTELVEMREKAEGKEAKER